MATLTLKRKPAPKPDVVGCFAVMRQSSNSKAMRFTKFHDDQGESEREAARLSDLIGKRFLVVRVESCFDPVAP